MTNNERAICFLEAIFAELSICDDEVEQDMIDDLADQFDLVMNAGWNAACDAAANTPDANCYEPADIVRRINALKRMV